MTAKRWMECYRRLFEFVMSGGPDAGWHSEEAVRLRMELSGIDDPARFSEVEPETGTPWDRLGKMGQVRVLDHAEKLYQEAIK